MAWRPRAELANAQFEAYRLEPDLGQIETYRLPGQALSASTGQQLSYKALKAHFLHSFLKTGDGEQLAYVDSNGFVILVRLAEGAPSFRPLHRLDLSPEYLPSVVRLDADRWLAHAGGSDAPLQVLSLGQTAAAISLPEELRGKPLTLVESATGDRVLVQASLESAAAGSSRDLKFQVALFQLDTAAGTTAILWRLFGDEPLYLGRPIENDSWRLFSETAYTSEQVQLKKKQVSSAPSDGPQGNAFEWTQTNDTVTLAFHSLPSTLTTADFRIHFSPPAGFSLTLRPSSEVSAGQRLARAMRDAGRYEKRTFWAPIDVEGSLWQWERDSGLLTIHLEKKHHGTKWLQVFDGSQIEALDDGLTDHVLETMDPSELLNAVEGLEKYTADEQARTSSSLLQDGLEDEDAAIGRPLVVTDVGSDSSSTTHSDHMTLLCLPLAPQSTVTLQHQLDGCLWRVDGAAPEHVDTMPALSYVLASKQGAKRCYAVQAQNRAVAFAFDDAGVLFWYASPEPRASRHGRSTVLDLETPIIDAVLVGEAVVCLTQHALVVLRNLL